MKSVKYLIERYYQVQEHRMAVFAQVRELEEMEDDATLIKSYAEEFQRLEKNIAKDIEKAVKGHAMFPWFKSVKGIGPILSAALITNIDIERAQHPSSIWKYCGLAVDLDTGEAEKRVKGKKIEYNPFMKKTCWLIGESFVKTRGKYRTIYDTSKAYYQKKYPKEVPVKGTKRIKYTKGHIHSMAKRRAVKHFLADMYAEWRTIEGLPTSTLFAERIVH